MASILIVDDIAVNRSYLMQLLEHKDYTVLEAESGEQAFTEIQRSEPDLVISDILMPGIDGYEFVRRLRKSTDMEIAATPVIFYTAHFLDQDSRELARMGGVLHFLVKPSEPAVILDTVAMALKESEKPLLQSTTEDYEARHLRLITDKLAEKTGELRTTDQRLAALLELNMQLAAQRDLALLLKIVCHGARELVGAKHAIIAVRGDNSESVPYFATSGIDQEVEVPEIHKGVLGEVLSEKRVENQSGTYLDARWMGLPQGYPGFDTFLAVPVTSVTRSYGWLCLTGKMPEGSGFRDDDEMLMNILAAQTGRIYENGSLYMQLRRHATNLEQEVYLRSRAQRLLRAEFEVARLLTTSETLEDFIPDLLAAIGQYLDFTAGRLYAVNEEQEKLVCMDGWFDDARFKEKFRELSRDLELSVERGPQRQVWETRAPLWIDDFTRDPEFENVTDTIRSIFREYGLHAVVLVPISGQGRLRGLLALQARDVRKREQDVLDVLNSIASQIGQYLERLQQQSRIVKLNRVHAVLSGINNTIVHVHEQQKLFEKACEIIVDQGRFLLAWIALFDAETMAPDTLTARARRHTPTLPDKLGNALNEKSEKHLVRQIVEKGSTVVCNTLNPAADAEKSFPLAGTALEMGAQSAAAFPLNLKGDMNGMLIIYAEDAGYFDNDELQLLNELTSDINFAMQYISNEERITHLAYRDQVTGLLNRISLYERLRYLIEDNAERNNPLALIVVNINNFRDINNTLGHPNGDKVLKQVGRRLQEAVWDKDLVACLGGDNFAVLLSRLADKEDIFLVIDKINDALQQRLMVSRIPIAVEATMGTVLYPDHGDDAATLLQRADIALREARRGNHRHLFYSKRIDHYDPRNLALVGQLEHAMESGELELHYQPKIDLKEEQVIGVEALIRWRHPDYGLLYPDAFIPLAEQTELINPLTRWTIQKALRQVLAWHQQGHPLDLSVNLSVRNLQNPALCDETVALTRETGFPLDRLKLEITETAIMADPKHAKAVLNDLHESGIRFSLDDFGIGQSSFVYLRDLPISRLKIDKSFVIGFREPHNMALVISTIELGHNLGLSVTAEGIEDKFSYEYLRDYGCDIGQGFYFSKPLPPDGLADWLRQSIWGQQQEKEY